MPQTLRVPLADLEPVAPVQTTSTIHVPLADLTLVPPPASVAPRVSTPLPAAATRGMLPPATFLERVRDVGLSAVKGAIAVPEAAVGLLDIPTGGRVGKALDTVGFRPAEAKAILDTYYSEQQQKANRTVAEADGVLNTVTAALKNPSTIAHAVVQSAPLMLGGAGIARGLIKAGVPVVAAAAAGEGAASAGIAAEQIRQESPDRMLTSGQAALAAGSGAVTGALGAFGARVAKALKIADVDTLLAGAVRDKAARTNLVKAVVKAAVQEGFIEELPQSVQEQVAQNLATKRPIWQGVAQEAVLGALAGAVMGGGSQVGARMPVAQAVQPATVPPAPNEGVAAQPPPVAPTARVAPPVAPAPTGTITAPVAELVPVQPSPAAPQPPAPVVAPQAPPPAVAPAVPPETAGDQPFHGKVGVVTQIMPSELKPLNPREMATARSSQRRSGLPEVDWAKTIDLSDPIEATLFADGDIRIQDGHHRYLAASILGVPVKVTLQAVNVRRDVLNTTVDRLRAGVQEVEPPPVMGVQVEAGTPTERPAEVPEDARNAAAVAEAAAEPPARQQPAWVAAGREMERRVREGVSPTGVERRAELESGRSTPPTQIPEAKVAEP